MANSPRPSPCAQPECSDRGAKQGPPVAGGWGLTIQGGPRGAKGPRERKPYDRGDGVSSFWG